MPILLSKNVLKDMEMITDFGKNQITTPQLREEGQYLKVRESCTGHMLMPMTKKAWKADIKTYLTAMVYVSAPDDEKMNAKSPIDMDMGSAIDGRLEMATTKHILGDDDEKIDKAPSREISERISSRDVCHGGWSVSICTARPCVKVREHAGSCFCRFHLPYIYIYCRRSAPETIMGIRSLGKEEMGQ